MHDGVLYGSGTWSVIFALDARSGALKWKWDPGIIRGGRTAGGQTVINGAPNRGVALYNGKVYAGLQDGRLVALDAATGNVVWVRMTIPYGNSEYVVTGAPRIVKGRVVIGNGGAEFHNVRGYVTAYDAETGDQAWRFYIVPGDPSQPFESKAMEMAARTWAGEWWKYGGGGNAWDSFSYDPDANLLYIGTGNGAPWSHHWRSKGEGDNLFLNSIVAVNADTGEYVWHYQTVPGDNWDYTSTMTMTLADLVIDGQPRKVLMQAPKNGFFYVIDRLTGRLISAEKLADHVTWATHVDMKTGRPVESKIARYDTTGAWISPAQQGAHNWHPMAFSPRTGLVYIPGQNNQSFYRLASEYVPQLGRTSTGLVRGPGDGAGAAGAAAGRLPGRPRSGDPARSVAHRTAHVLERRRAGHRQRRAVQRTAKRRARRPRCQNRGRAVGERHRAGAGRADHLRARRPPVRHGAVGCAARDRGAWPDGCRPSSSTDEVAFTTRMACVRALRSAGGLPRPLTRAAAGCGICHDAGEEISTMRYLVFSLATLTCALGVIGSSQVGVAQQPTAGFTPAQAQQGSVVYKESCAQCHGANLEGGGGAGARRSDVPGRMAIARRRRAACARSPGRCRRAIPAR